MFAGLSRDFTAPLLSSKYPCPTVDSHLVGGTSVLGLPSSVLVTTHKTVCLLVMVGDVYALLSKFFEENVQLLGLREG